MCTIDLLKSHAVVMVSFYFDNNNYYMRTGAYVIYICSYVLLHFLHVVQLCSFSGHLADSPLAFCCLSVIFHGMLLYI